MKLLLLRLSFLLSLLLAACGDYSYPKELSTADSLMDARPDRAMHIFKQLTIDSNAPESHRMYYELLRIKAKDKAAHLEKGDSIILHLLDYYIDGGKVSPEEGSSQFTSMGEDFGTLIMFK